MSILSAAKGIVTAKVVYCVSVPYNSTLPVVVHSAVVESLASTAFSYSYSAKVTVDIRSCVERILKGDIIKKHPTVIRMTASGQRLQGVCWVAKQSSIT